MPAGFGSQPTDGLADRISVTVARSAQSRVVNGDRHPQSASQPSATSGACLRQSYQAHGFYPHNVTRDDVGDSGKPSCHLSHVISAHA